MRRRSILKSLSLAAMSTALISLSGGAYAANEVLKIGFVGVTSGPAAA